ncbi:hypothetical protein [Glycomyces terrestris]|uniref:Uncharacterized protein n=1 Tax=Glycomyces terrestris TaxID=2493553 RepID=A0A426V3U1_9ACTN|nr:hypothetical protein [Glycomyces terrestris]RRS01501.1 hypothetical protein EIW28_01660 [Glycomyces terrestris]
MDAKVRNTGFAAALGVVASILAILAFFNIDSISDFVSSGPEDACARAWEAMYAVDDTQISEGLREAAEMAGTGELRYRLETAANAYAVRADAASMIDAGRLTETVDAANEDWQAYCE